LEIKFIVHFYFFILNKMAKILLVDSDYEVIGDLPENTFILRRPKNDKPTTDMKTEYVPDELHPPRNGLIDVSHLFPKRNYDGNPSFARVADGNDIFCWK
jgi:hypothetical protein